MERIETVERRLSEALDRIGAALSAPRGSDEGVRQLVSERDGALADAASLRAEAAALRERLDDEALLGQQLKARNAALHDRVSQLEADVARLSQELAQRDSLLGQIRRVNTQLRQNNLALREAAVKGMPDAHLVNKAMLAELESIRASRDADRAEIDRVLAGLQGLMGPEPDVEEEGADA